MTDQARIDGKAWGLSNSCEGKFAVGDKVRTRGDMGGFVLTVEKIHNHHYAACRGYGKLRHFNMNTLELVTP